MDGHLQWSVGTSVRVMPARAVRTSTRVLRACHTRCHHHRYDNEEEEGEAPCAGGDVDADGQRSLPAGGASTTAPTAGTSAGTTPMWTLTATMSKTARKTRARPRLGAAGGGGEAEVEEALDAGVATEAGEHRGRCWTG